MALCSEKSILAGWIHLLLHHSVVVALLGSRAQLHYTLFYYRTHIAIYVYKNMGILRERHS